MRTANNHNKVSYKSNAIYTEVGGALGKKQHILHEYYTNTVWV